MDRLKMAKTKMEKKVEKMTDKKIDYDINYTGFPRRTLGKPSPFRSALILVRILVTDD